MEMFGERYLIDLVPIPLCGNKVIVGMDWLSPNGAVIVCELQMIRVRTQSGGELVVHAEDAHRKPVLSSAARARHYLHQGCSGFVAYVMDT